MEEEKGTIGEGDGKVDEKALLSPELEAEKKKRARKIAGVVIGLILLSLGLFSASNSDELNEELVEIGTRQSVYEMVDSHPDTRELFLQAADTLESALNSGETDSEKLEGKVTQAKDTELFRTRPYFYTALSLVTVGIKEAKKKAADPEEFTEKLRRLVSGIREGAGYIPPEI